MEAAMTLWQSFTVMQHTIVMHSLLLWRQTIIQGICRLESSQPRNGSFTTKRTSLLVKR